MTNKQLDRFSESLRAQDKEFLEQLAPITDDIHRLLANHQHDRATAAALSAIVSLQTRISRQLTAQMELLALVADLLAQLNAKGE